MSTFKTEAVVLSKRPFIEDDRFYTIYSKDYGKLEVFVKAAAKSSSKLAGHLEPFSYVELMIAKGKSKETVAGSKLLKFYSIEDLDGLTLANLIAEVLAKITKPGVPDENIFQMLLKLLPFLADSSKLELKRLATLRFIWQLLKSLGYGLTTKNTPSFEKLPKLSLSANKLLTQQLLSKGNSTFFTTSRLELKEVEDFTVSFLNHILESDLKSLKMLSYV